MKVTIRNTTFEELNGHAVDIISSRSKVHVFIEDCLFQHNVLGTTHGGVVDLICYESCEVSVEIIRSQFIGNRGMNIAEDTGCGSTICFIATGKSNVFDIKLTSVECRNNSVTASGGVMTISSYGKHNLFTTVIENSTFRKNSAGDAGGAIFVFANQCFVLLVYGCIPIQDVSLQPTI